MRLVLAFLYLIAHFCEEWHDICTAGRETCRDFGRPSLLLRRLHQPRSQPHALEVWMDGNHVDLEHVALGETQDAAVNLDGREEKRNMNVCQNV